MPSPRLGLALAAPLGTALGAANLTTEYLALAPQGPAKTPFTRLEWVQVTYPAGVSDADDVAIVPLDDASPPPEVGAWLGLDTEYGLTLTGKIFKDQLYAYLSVGTNGEKIQGCCADTLRVYSRSSDADASRSHHRDVNLTAIVNEALPNAKAAATHTFDVKEIDGVLYGFAVVRYAEPALGGSWADAVVKFSTEDGAVSPTADGRKAFAVFAEVGEVTPEAAHNPYVINYVAGPRGGRRHIAQQWHANGIERFVSSSGVAVLAMTFRKTSEAVLFKDPFAYRSSDGGGKILQRFGTPMIGPPHRPPPNASPPHRTPPNRPSKRSGGEPHRRYFGTKATDPLGAFYGGVHNIYHRASSEALNGRESISIFVNLASSATTTPPRSYAVEFAVRLTEKAEMQHYDDNVFDTDYVAAKLSFATPTQGGARAIGDGVFLVTSGIDRTGLEVADVRGNRHSYALPSGEADALSDVNRSGPWSHPPGLSPERALYDPFIFVCKGQERSRSESLAAIS